MNTTPSSAEPGEVLSGGAKKVECWSEITIKHHNIGNGRRAVTLKQAILYAETGAHGAGRLDQRVPAGNRFDPARHLPQGDTGELAVFQYY